MAKRKVYKREKGTTIETFVWECPNGHWSRVEYTDSITSPIHCAICDEPMELGARMLEPLKLSVYR